MNASGRLNTCKARGPATVTVVRVRNAYATYLPLGDSPGKPGLIPHDTAGSPGLAVKDLSVGDGHASD